MKLRTTPAALAATLLAALVLGGCAATGVGKTPEQIVAERAAARWQAIIANQWPNAYEYATPGYRAATSVEVFQGTTVNAAIRRETAEVVRVECSQADSCTATVRLTYQPIMPGYPRMSTELNERWMLDDGTWYIHLPF